MSSIKLDNLHALILRKVDLQPTRVLPGILLPLQRMADCSNENIRWSIKWALCNCWCVFTWKLSCCIQPQWTQSGCQTLLLLELWAWKHKLKENTKWFNCYISRNVNYLWLLCVFHWEYHVVLKYSVWYWTEFTWSGCQLPVQHILETDFRSSVFAVDANSFLLEPSSFGTWQKIIWIVWRQFCSCFTLGLLGRLIAIISSLLSWRKILDLECLSSFLAEICPVSDPWEQKW